MADNNNNTAPTTLDPHVIEWLVHVLSSSDRTGPPSKTGRIRSAEGYRQTLQNPLHKLSALESLDRLELKHVWDVMPTPWKSLPAPKATSKSGLVASLEQHLSSRTAIQGCKVILKSMRITVPAASATTPSTTTTTTARSSSSSSSRKPSPKKSPRTTSATPNSRKRKASSTTSTAAAVPSPLLPNAGAAAYHYHPPAAQYMAATAAATNNDPYAQYMAAAYAGMPYVYPYLPYPMTAATGNMMMMMNNPLGMASSPSGTSGPAAAASAGGANSNNSNRSRSMTTTPPIHQRPNIARAPASAPPAAAAAASTSHHGNNNNNMPTFEEFLRHFGESSSSSSSSSPVPMMSGATSLLQRVRIEGGFGNTNEIQQAIQQLLRNDPQTLESGLTVQEVICEIIRAREDAQLARDMDEARRQSELEHQLEQERLKTTRQWEQEQRLLNASLHQLLHPNSVEDRKLFFPRSWLLKHDPLKSWLEAIWKDNVVSLKKGIIQLLRHEKNAFKWYSGGIPKSYFTCAIGKRLLQYSPPPHGTESALALEQELTAISVEIEEGTALPSKQNKDRVPLIFIQAREKEKENTNDPQQSQQHQSDNDGEDGSDDEIQILDEEEIRQLKGLASSSSAVPAAIELDDGGN